MSDNTIDQSPVEESAKAKILKKLGKYGFLFFLIKGLIWLAIAAAAYFGITK